MDGVCDGKAHPLEQLAKSGILCPLTYTLKATTTSGKAVDQILATPNTNANASGTFSIALHQGLEWDDCVTLEGSVASPYGQVSQPRPIEICSGDGFTKTVLPSTRRKLEAVAALTGELLATLSRQSAMKGSAKSAVRNATATASSTTRVEYILPVVRLVQLRDRLRSTRSRIEAGAVSAADWSMLRAESREIRAVLGDLRGALSSLGEATGVPTSELRAVLERHDLAR